MQAPRKIRASNHRPEPGGLSRYLPDGAALNKPFREYAIAAKIGCTPQTLRDGVRKAEVDSGQRVVGRLACHGSILSGVGASGKPGAVHSYHGCEVAGLGVGIGIAARSKLLKNACPGTSMTR